MYSTLFLLNYDFSFKDISKLALKSSLSYNDIKEKLIKDNFIEILSDSSVNLEKEISKLSVSELFSLLKKYGINASGKPKKLVKLAIKNVPRDEFISANIELTSKGHDFLNKFSWMKLYDYALNSFNFGEYYTYHKEHEGEDYQIALDFVDSHLKIANINEDFLHCENSYLAKSLIYLSIDDFQHALEWQLKRFILRLNPNYYTYADYYFEYLIFIHDNRDYINIILEKLDINDLKDVFGNIWNSMDLKKEYVSVDTAFDYLERFLNGENCDDLTGEFYNKYFENYTETFNYALFFYNRHNYLVASEFFDFSFESDMTKDEALYYEALSDCYLKNWKSALDIINEALEINSSDGRYFNVKAIALFEFNNVVDAKKYFNKALQLCPNDSTILSCIGVCFAHQEKFEKAIEYFDKAIDTVGDNPRFLINKAKVYAKLNDLDKADELFKKALELNPDDKNSLVEQGCYSLFKNDYEKACEYFDKFLKLYGEYSPVLHLKYLSLYELGYKEEYDEFKSQLSNLDKRFVNALENYLKK